MRLSFTTAPGAVLAAALLLTGGAATAQDATAQDATAQNATAQNAKPEALTGWRKHGYAPVVAGWQLMRPLSLPQGTYQGRSPYWQGVHYRTKQLELDWAAASLYRSNPALDPTARLERQQFIGLGFHQPVSALGLGARHGGIKGSLLEPFVAAQVGLWTLGDQYKSAWQLGAAPGLSLQLPYVVLDARLQAAYCFGAADKRGGDRQFRGLQLVPTLALQFDGLWEVFGARRTSEKQFHEARTETVVTRSVDRVERATYTYSNGGSTTYTTTYTSTSTQQVYHPAYTSTVYHTVVDPWWGLGPRVQWSPARDYRGTTLTGGLQASARINAFAFDVFAEYGQTGLASSLDSLPTMARPKPEAGIDRTDDQFSGTRLGSGRVMGRMGVDVFGILRTLAQNGHTKYFRLNVGAGAGYALPGSRIRYKHPDQEQWLDAKLADGNPQQFVRNYHADARLATAGLAVQAFTQLEVGPVSLSLERNRYYRDPLGDNYTVAVTWLLPVQRLRQTRLRYVGEAAD
jgi:hypothetical protein